MLDAVGSAFSMVFGGHLVAGVIPELLLYTLLGALAGMFLGLIPGLGGLVGLSILLPFTFTMEPEAALCVAIGILSTTNATDIIPAVLFAVPGTAAAQATVLDGHPMARRGEAGRALGAAYSASILGALFGAVVLVLTIPVMRQLVLLMGSPEFLMLCLLGVSMVATLSGRSPIRGLIVGVVGLAIGMFGANPQTGAIRWSFGSVYLADGIPLVPVALGLFSLPELIDVAMTGRSFAGTSKASQRVSGIRDGIRDTLRNKALVLRSSVLGVWAGAVPGLGGTVIDWLAYGQAYQTVKGAKETFGKGDVRGVIAPESANNSKEGGSLVPTIAFGVPGSPGMALLLAIFLVAGITPGRPMLTTHLDITFMIVLILVLANLFGAAVCLALGRYTARIASLPIQYVAPVVIVLMFAASLQSTHHLGDLVVLVVAAIAGWFMKRLNWPRPPLLIAFVLSPLIENYFFISTARYGAEWLMRPVVVAIGLVIAVSLFFGIRSSRRGSYLGQPPTLATEGAAATGSAAVAGVAVADEASSPATASAGDDARPGEDR